MMSTAVVGSWLAAGASQGHRSQCAMVRCVALEGLRLRRCHVTPSAVLSAARGADVRASRRSAGCFRCRASWHGRQSEASWRDTWASDTTAQSAVGRLLQHLQELAETEPGKWGALASVQHEELSDRVATLTDVLGLQSPLQTVEVVWERPEVALAALDELAGRVLRLKEVLPQANLAAVLQMRPGLLTEPEADVAADRAVRMMLKLMPGLPVQEQLHRGESQWRTFVDLLHSELPAAARMRSSRQRREFKEGLRKRALAETGRGDEGARAGTDGRGEGLASE